MGFKRNYADNDGVWLTLPQVAARYNIGVSAARKYSKEFGADRFLGRNHYVDRKTFDAGMERAAVRK